MNVYRRRCMFKMYDKLIINVFFQLNNILDIDMFNIINIFCFYNNWVIIVREFCVDLDRYYCLIDEYFWLGWICMDLIWVEVSE